MITTPSSKNNFKTKHVRNFGDPALFFGCLNTPVVRLLIFNTKKGLWLLFKQWKSFNTAVMAFCMTVIFRYRFGIKNCGLGLSLSAISFLLIYNSAEIPIICKPFALFILPFLIIWKDGEELYQMAFVDVHSQGLWIYTMMLTACSIGHVFMVYAGFGNSDLSKRGESWIYTLLTWLQKKYPKTKYSKINVSEYFICCYVEPIIVIVAGLVLWMYYEDRYFAVFCWLMVTCEILQQLTDKSYQIHQQSVLRA